MRRIQASSNTLNAAHSNLQAEYHVQKLLVVDGYNTVLVRVVLPERGRKRVQNYAALNKVIEQNCAISVSIKLPNERIVKPIREAIAKCRQRRLQLVFVDVSRVVRVERTETVLPVSHVLPEGSKILKIHDATTRAIEHANHKPNRLRIERVPRSVREGLLQLVLRYESTSVAIYFLEDAPQKLLVWHAGHGVKCVERCLATKTKIFTNM